MVAVAVTAGRRDFGTTSSETPTCPIAIGAGLADLRPKNSALQAYRDSVEVGLGAKSRRAAALQAAKERAQAYLARARPVARSEARLTGAQAMQEDAQERLGACSEALLTGA